MLATVRAPLWRSCHNVTKMFSLQVMMEFRNSDSRHVDWVKALKQVFQQLKAYVKQHHMAGPAWNANGMPFKDFKLDSSGAAAPSPAPASAPKPPPPGEQQCS